ncbi:MAG: AAA family ATPase [Proteobacteria bacterium]|nr:AAA family ATPase [Pseudomonadota bacterium]NBP15826.1 AAA family ATPase [bacterium]
MIKNIVQRLSFFKKVLLCTGLLCLNHSLVAASMPSVPNQLNSNAVSTEEKNLQIRLLTILDCFSICLHKIGIRVSGLKLSAVERNSVKEWITQMQEHLKVLKSKQSLQFQSKQVIQTILILSEVVKGVEESLKQSLKASPEINDSVVKRSIKEINPEEIETLLHQTEKRLQGFDKLINNMNKTTFNRFYTWVSDKWNTPLYSFSGLSARESQNVYFSSILKRFVIYGTGLGLIVRNLPQHHIDAIPSNFIKNWIVQPVKNIVGGSSFTTQVTTEDKGIPVNPVATDNNLYFGNINTCNQIIQKNGQGFPTITDTHGNPLPVIWKDGNYQVDLSFLTDEEKGNFTDLYLVLKDGSKLEITHSDIEKIISNGDMWALPSGGIIKKVAHDTYIDLTTGKKVLLSEETLENVLKDNNQIGHFAIKSPYSCNTHPVPPALILNKDIEGIATSTTITKNIDQLDEKGFFSKIIGNFNWLTSLELAKISFQIPIAAYVCTAIHEDIQNAGKIIPYFAARAHKKMRGENNLPIDLDTKPTQTFDEIVGREAHKKALQPLIDFVSSPDAFIQTGIELPRGWLFSGEPQTGKTLMVRALAGELSKTIKNEQGVNRDVKLFSIQVHDLIKYGLQTYIDVLKSQAPCILFCDEFDLTGAQRDRNINFLAESLQALSGYATSSDLQELVLFVIATNCPENIDYALINDGRFGKKLYFENPYFKDRRDYFEKHFKSKIVDVKMFDLDRMAQETENCSYGTLKTIVDEIERSARADNMLPCQIHADYAIDAIVKKIIHHDDDISAEATKILAARFAAKAFASVVLDSEQEFTCATILKITEDIKEKSIINHFVSADKKEKAGIRFGKIFCYHKNDTYNLITQKELLNACKIAVAGTEGQKVLGLDYTAYTEDEQEALMLARKIVLDGIDEKYLPKKILQEKYMQAYTLVQDCKQEMRKLLTEHKAAYNKLVTLLERRKTIRIDAIKECFGKDLRLIKASYTAQQVPLTFSQEPLSSQTLEFTEEDNDDDDQEQALQEQSELEQAQAAHYKLLQDNQNSKTEYA